MDPDKKETRCPANALPDRAAGLHKLPALARLVLKLEQRLAEGGCKVRHTLSAASAASISASISGVV
jgi:hypothetical protein